METFEVTHMRSAQAHLTEPQWRCCVLDHSKRLEPWAHQRRDRAGRQIKHPVYDFLFEYYSYRPAQILKWSPGVGVFLVDATPDSFLGAAELTQVDGGLILEAKSFPAHRQPYIEWALRYLHETEQRAPQFACFGLHEWAMLYRAEVSRYPEIPLRLSFEDIRAVVEGSELRCTHYDAFRHFTPEAQPLNRTMLAREQTVEHDQPGCIHVTMDLYRFALKIAPYVPSKLLADTFELACHAREVDMRASPYDLTAFGFTPIEIECVSGREEYVREQRRLTEYARPLRSALRTEYVKLRKMH